MKWGRYRNDLDAAALGMGLRGPRTRRRALQEQVKIGGSLFVLSHPRSKVGGWSSDYPSPPTSR